MAASPTASTITVQTRHQSNVLARLQALFPTSPTTTNGPIPPPLSPGPANHYGEKGPKPSVSLKIRMVSWNMHSSLPKGDLTHLFGRVPLYRPSELSESGIPQFPVEDQHPYHLIVVAGQECPSVSGIPLGIGAGFRLKDRDRESDRDSTRHKDDSKEASPHEALGWTGMVEDWLCHGGQHAPATPADISAPKPLSARGTPVERKGPYQLLVKERLMGLYMAIYIHRDLRPLVKGMSRSVVTTGLLRGRVGNKGGVGISLSIGGTTLLFINAHLAAHENKVHHRLADLAKIKAELSVEDFLPPDDPRVMAEDIVDKFDYSFLLGDLNFRLDISRLHADWLISREDYAQALTFDQLRNLMASGTSFVGWQEAEIRFAPTFKYDVLRTVKAKRRGSKLDRLRDRPRQLTEVDEHVDETVQEILDAEDADSDRDGEGGEAASLASSVWTSMHSKHATDDDYFQPSPSSNAMSSLSSPGSRISISVAAHRAKSKWMALLSPASPNAPSKWLKARHASLFPPSPSTESKMSRHRSLDAPVLPPSLKRLGSTKSSAQSDEEDERGDDKGIYDTSYKKRVPSWCDRVLAKTTIQQPPDMDDELSEAPSSRPRTRVGQFFVNAFRPLASRARRGSYSSFVSAVSASASASSAHDHDPEPTTNSSPSSPEIEHIAPFSRFVETPSPLQRSRSTEFFSNREKPPLPSRTISHEVAPELKRSNSGPHTPPTARPRRATISPEGPAQRVVTPGRWRFLPSFLSHASSQSASSQDASFNNDTLTPTRPPRRGDMVCQRYDTLTDREMRSLEGRSDHRPVLASYVVYI